MLMFILSFCFLDYTFPHSSMSETNKVGSVIFRSTLECFFEIFYRFNVWKIPWRYSGAVGLFARSRIRVIIALQSASRSSLSLIERPKQRYPTLYTGGYQCALKREKVRYSWIEFHRRSKVGANSRNSKNEDLTPKLSTLPECFGK